MGNEKVKKGPPQFDPNEVEALGAWIAIVFVSITAAMSHLISWQTAIVAALWPFAFIALIFLSRLINGGGHDDD
ncbi:MAG: hypothetical protein ACTHJ9_05280 [Rhodanobacter sp.]